jgi:hypothetical protein
MNTDNMMLAGRTLDYGPYGWMERFDCTPLTLIFFEVMIQTINLSLLTKPTLIVSRTN